MRISPASLIPCALWAAALSLPAASAAETDAQRIERWRALLASAEAAAPDRPDDAEAGYRRVVAEAEAAGGGGLPEVRAFDGLADVLRRTARCGEAIALYRKAAAGFERLLGPRQPRVAVSLHNLGVCLSGEGRHTEAVSSLERALEIWVSTYGEASPNARNTGVALRLAREASAGD